MFPPMKPIPTQHDLFNHANIENDQDASLTPIDTGSGRPL